MTYSEAIYIILDLAKAATSDDSFLNEAHVKFLLNKYRQAILRKEYRDIKKTIPQSNYQTICLNLQDTLNVDGNVCAGSFVKSTDKIPDMMEIGNVKVYPVNYFMSDINYINKDRFKYAGSEKYNKNSMYATIADDDYLYLKSGNPQHKYLKCVKLTGIFEDADTANELDCTNSKESCDPMDSTYPLEDALFPQVMALVLKDIVGAEYKPQDSGNDANDDLSSLATFIRQNTKSTLAKQLENE